MIKLSAAALSYAHRPGFKALLFSDVKAPAEGAQSAASSEAAADLTKMGLTVLRGCASKIKRAGPAAE